MVVLLLLAAALAGCGSDDDGNDDGAAAPADTADTVELVATDFAFEPSSLTLDAAGEHTLTLRNDGEFPHAIAFDDLDGTTGNVDPGASGEVTVDLEPGSYTVYCPVGNHRDQGMEGTLVVGGASASGGGSGDGDGDDYDDGYGYGYGYGYG
ncbi:MAG TPA: cupredoxin domain-containing protein [Gaiellaceae bacterium]|nr:cupredoxin domain-containing protein [Gaiellaceae bacterium]